MKASLVRLESGEEVAEAEVLRWAVAEGDTVAAGTLLVEVDAHKTTVEVRAQCPGVLLKILHREGATCRTDSVLGVIGPSGADYRDVMAALSDGDNIASGLTASVGLRCRGECPECGARIAINGPVSDATCGECGLTTSIPASLWNAILDSVADETETVRAHADGWVVVARLSVGAPQCHNCATTLSPLGEPGDEATVSCSKCGLTHEHRVAPPWMRGRFPWLVALLGTSAAAPLRVSEAPKCDSCGAPAPRPDAAAPIPRCLYCGADIWLRAAHAPLPRRWYLLR